MSSTPDTNIRDKATETIKTLPDDASWDDVMYRIYVRQKIENGLKDVTDGNTVTVSDVRKRFGLPECCVSNGLVVQSRISLESTLT